MNPTTSLSSPSTTTRRVDAAAGFAPMPLPPLPADSLVSVLITNYNYERYLERSIRSVFVQTYRNWELVVYDDGSSDGSVDIARRLIDGEPRARLVAAKNAGQCAAVGLGAQQLRGDIACLLDSDDEFAPGKIAAIVAAFRRDPQAGFCSNFLRAVDGDGRVLLDRTPSGLDRGWLGDTAAARGGCVTIGLTSALSFRAEVFRRLVPLPAAQPNDADGYFGMVAQFLTRFVAVEETLGDYRVHGNNMGGLVSFDQKRLAYELRLIRTRTKNLNAFLAALGPGVDTPIDVLRNVQFVQTSLKMRALGDTQESPLSTAELIARHPAAFWRRFWGVAFKLPSFLRTPLLRSASGAFRVKAVVMPLIDWHRKETPSSPPPSPESATALPS